MDDKLLEIKAAETAAITALNAILGWRGILAVAWVAAMALDYISGTMAACKLGQWCSARAREGLWHKAGSMIAVMVAWMADLVMGIVCQYLPIGYSWPGMILPLALSWYIITELGSIVENVVKMGANVPGWLIKLLKASTKAMDAAGEQAANKNENGGNENG